MKFLKRRSLLKSGSILARITQNKSTQAQ